MSMRRLSSQVLSWVILFVTTSCMTRINAEYGLGNAETDCKANTHWEGTSCVANEEDCFIVNGNGVRLWEADQWGPCEIASCAAGHHLENDSCLSNIRGCLIENGEGTQEWAVTWGECQVSLCEAGFHPEDGACWPDVRACEISGGEGEQSWETDAFGDCRPVTCLSDHHIEDDACAADLRECIIDGGSGIQSWMDGMWNECTAICGNGITQQDELCDEGAENGTSGCNAACGIDACGTDSVYLASLARGWRVCLSDRIDEMRRITVLSRIDDDMAFIREILPEHAAQQLRSVTIWVERDLPGGQFPGAVFHPSAQWLSANGYPVEWAGDIQIGNATNYLDWTSHQPAMLLHELAHAWDFQKYQYGQPAVVAAYEAAMSAGLYDRVRYYNGSYFPAYAATSAVEYFAELTEAFFWNENDYFPFTADDLLTHDLQGYQAVHEAWELPWTHCMDGSPACEKHSQAHRSAL